ncbi:hypothetical protein JW935_13835 [candidate division KSB1 bacterium]|nr:hypothetical protein [candidate division KSB1 bacterium]
MSIRSLQNDNLSGAGEILIKAGEMYKDFFERQTGSGAEDFQIRIQKFGATVVSAQPRMAPLWNLTERVTDACKSVKSVSSKKRVGLSTVDAYLQSYKKAQAGVVPFCLPLLGVKTVCTYSRSSLVRHVLFQAKSLGYQFAVCLTESRPMMEGRLLASELADTGIPVTLMADAAMSRAVEQGDVVFVGADAYWENKIVNKVGTDILALLANLYRRPIFVLTTTHKYLPPGVSLPAETEHNSDELWPEAPCGVKISNRYFIDVPRRLFSGIITEEGRE